VPPATNNVHRERSKIRTGKEQSLESNNPGIWVTPILISIVWVDVGADGGDTWENSWKLGGGSILNEKMKLWVLIVTRKSMDQCMRERHRHLQAVK
jgi:hypothetical protein